MRVYSKSGYASWSVWSPGEVAERHRKKVSSRARVREHSARIQSCGHLGVFITHGNLQSTSYKLLTFRMGLRALVKSSWEGRVWRFCPQKRPDFSWLRHGSNLVDSASSHTLVSKIKPCTSENKEFSLNLRMAHYISYSLFDSPLLLG